MMELLSDPQAWLAFLTLSALEIILGIDNIIFISILVGRLPVHQREVARISGFVSFVSHTMENSSAMRVSIASARPVMRADSRRSGGSRLTRIEMKMMLSMPSTISSADSVTNAIHAWGSVSISITAEIVRPWPRYGSSSMGSLRTVGNRCSALSPKSSATALEM